MLDLILKESNNGKYVYYYYPEGIKKDFGELTCDSNTGEIEVVKLHPDDKHELYVYHAWSRIKKYFQSNDYLETDLVAWV